MVTLGPTEPEVPRPQPPGAFLPAVLTMLALLPFGAVAGLVVALLTGWERVLCVLLGALLGALYSLWKWSR
jgi:hypothetical protein